MIFEEVTFQMTTENPIQNIFLLSNQNSCLEVKIQIWKEKKSIKGLINNWFVVRYPSYPSLIPRNLLFFDDFALSNAAQSSNYLFLTIIRVHNAYSQYCRRIRGRSISTSKAFPLNCIVDYIRFV